MRHGVTFHATEVLQNVLIFMPFGIYLCLLLPKSRFWREIAFDFRGKFATGNLSVCLSDWPRSDITDLITNVCGGLFGIILYKAAIRLFRNKNG